jgi:CheY-like chemotaxis protein
MTKSILVVEDQPDNRQIIRDMLARTDYEITEAENGEEALAAIAKQRPESHPYGYPTADHGRLHGRKPN